MRYSAISRSASPMLASGPSVIGSTIIPDSERLTLRTVSACRSTSELLVDHADAALPRHRDRHRGLRDRVHGGRHDRDAQGHPAREAAATSTSLGSTEERRGTSSTSSNVSACVDDLRSLG
jgi:hypothetical protein